MIATSLRKGIISLPIVDRNLIKAPIIQVSESALMQIVLIKDNDHTLRGSYFRIAISGKGCDGFSYKTYFDTSKSDDFIISLKNNIDILLDPFTAFYLQHATLNYYFDPEENIEGFQVINLEQDKYKKKFWNINSDLTPPLVQK